MPRKKPEAPRPRGRPPKAKDHLTPVQHLAARLDGATARLVVRVEGVTTPWGDVLPWGVERIAWRLSLAALVARVHAEGGPKLHPQNAYLWRRSEAYQRQVRAWMEVSEGRGWVKHQRERRRAFVQAERNELLHPFRWKERQARERELCEKLAAPMGWSEGDRDGCGHPEAQNHMDPTKRGRWWPVHPLCTSLDAEDGACRVPGCPGRREGTIFALRFPRDLAD